MTQTITHSSHAQSKSKCDSTSRHAVRAETDRLLRDIAFVLKMTERVRDDIEIPASAEEPVLA